MMYSCNKNGDGVVIVYAGEGTIDISSYRNQKEKCEELAAPQCLFVFFTLKIAHYIPGHLHGFVFVTIHARQFLESMSMPNQVIISLVNLSA